MPPSAGNAPHHVLAVLRAHAARAAGANQFLAVGAQPLSGGRNNTAYPRESPDGPVCVKVYRVDNRSWPSHHVASVPLPLWAWPRPRAAGPARQPTSPT